MDTRDGALLDGSAAYNDDDCRATLALRDWLVAHRPEGTPWARVAAPTEPDDATAGEREALRQALVAGSEPGTPRWLAGELLEYHRREARPAWWWFFQRRDHMTVEELVDDAESIGRLTPIGRPRPDRNSPLHTLAFPIQQHKLGPGDHPFDPATTKGAGTIMEVDDLAGTLVLRRGPGVRGVSLPLSLIPGGPIATKEQRGALMRLAASVRAGDVRYPALRDILGRTPPRLRARPAGADVQSMNIRNVAESLDGSYLFGQGPRGHGRQRGHAGDRRGGPGLAGRCARDGDGGAQRHPAGRSASARAGLAGHASGGHREVGAGAPARRARDDPARPRCLPGTYAPHASGRLPVHLGDRVRLAAGRAAGAGAAGDRVRHGPAFHAGGPRRQHVVLDGGSAGGGGGDPQDGRRVVDESRWRDGTAPRAGLHGGRALQCPGAPAARRAARGWIRRHPRRHRGQVPGAGGAHRLLLDGDVERGGH